MAVCQVLNLADAVFSKVQISQRGQGLEARLYALQTTPNHIKSLERVTTGFDPLQVLGLTAYQSESYQIVDFGDSLNI